MEKMTIYKTIDGEYYTTEEKARQSEINYLHRNFDISIIINALEDFCGKVADCNYCPLFNKEQQKCIANTPWKWGEYTKENS